MPIEIPIRPLKILITSVGSLVGQNILDVLDHSDFSRRSRVRVIGTNSLAGSPNNFRCAKCYLVPQSIDPGFKGRILAVLEAENPDLVLSGRDEDTELVVRIMNEHGGLRAKHPYGSFNTIITALNKWETWLFAQRNGLAFAATYVVGKSGGLDGLFKFADNYGYPLIAKPIEGFASKGVFFVRDKKDAAYLSEFKGYMFQEYLGESDAMNSYFEKMRGLVPLFAHAPGIFHHSCHTVMSPNGRIDPVFISRNEHDSGVTVGFKRVEHEELDRLTLAYAAAVLREGGWGPMTVQFRQDRQGKWKAQEMNLRTNGNTFPRFLMGQDDLGLIVSGVLPEINFPIYEAPKENNRFIVGKSLRSDVMCPEALASIRDTGEWVA